MATESTTPQRPWAAVARYPEPFEPKAAVAHYAAMAYAHHLAFSAGILTAKTGDEALDLTNRHFHPMTAAFTSAASMDESRNWTSNLVREVLGDPGDMVEACHEWLTAAGIDPAQIEAAR